MLYVKVDANGNPTEVAKNFSEIKQEYTAKNTAIPIEIGFSANLSNFGYAEVPYSEPPVSESGKRVVPDIPIRQADGTMKRTWRQVDTSPTETNEVVELMRSRRSKLLREYIDSISPVRWDSWSEEEKTEIKNWRQSLLDISSQNGWPFVTFPPIPEPLLK